MIFSSFLKEFKLTPIVLLALFLLLSSCGSGSLKGDDPSKPVQTGGNEQYMLPELPYWANFSSVGQCFRNTPVHYLDIAKMNASFGLDYKKLIEFQILFNRSLEEKLKEISSTYLSPSMENRLFDVVYGKIDGEIKVINLPDFDRLHLIWIDSALGSNQEKEKLTRLLKKPIMKKGVPIFLSTCLTSREIETYVQKNEWQLPGFLTIGAEAFAIYDSKLKKTPSFSVNFTKLLGGDKWIYLFGPGPIVPKEFAGEIIMRSYD